MKRHNKKHYILKIFFLIVFIVVIYFITIYNELYEDANKLDVSIYYNEFVRTNKETEIYMKDNEQYKKVGKISSGIELSLNEVTNIEVEYFNIKELDEQYYIYYKDVEKIEELSEVEQRYKNYIPFNLNAITREITNFYDAESKLVYSIDKGYSFPIIIKEEDMYGVEFNNRLLYIKKEECEVVDAHNTDKKNTSGIGVLNYHFFYDDSSKEEKKECNQIICASKTQFKQHLDYIKENGFFTPNMKELEMYIDGNLQLPKSVVITIDDGWRMEIGIKMLEEYQFNATVFLITGWFDNIDFINKYKYVEFHSHGENLHNQGVCKGGQGGAIKCLPEQKLIDDLKLSQKKLGGSTVFCYPFYEYNSHSISVLKKAGYTMAFAGESSQSDNLVKVGANKYKLPRFVVVNYTTMRGLTNYLN